MTCTSVSAQITPDSLFERSVLLADLDSLHTTILRSHPNPFAFCEESNFEKAFSDCRNSLKDKTSLREFMRSVTIFLNILHDSHTSLEYAQLQNLQLKNGGFFMPLSVKMVRSDSFADEFDLCVSGDWAKEIPKGSKIISINGMDVQQLYQESMDYACIEGNSTMAQASVAAALLPLVTGFNHPYGQTNQVKFETGNGDVKEVAVAGYDKKGLDRLKKEHIKKDEWLPTLKVDSTMSLAVLKVGTFAPAKSGRYSKRIRQAIGEAQRLEIENLVIDIRGNGGGSSAWVEYLYSFIDSIGYNTPNNVIGKSSQLARERNRLFHRGFVQFFVRLLFSHDEDVQSYQRISELPFGTQDTIYFHKPTVQQSQYVFAGNCFLLINGLTASAGVDFTNAFKSKKRGLVVGEECLGPSTGTWGNPASYVLPNTRIRTTVATIRYNYDNSFYYEPNAIQPDFEVSYNAEDIASDEDTQLAFVKKLINENK